MKAKPIVYRGIEFVKISDLSPDQQSVLNLTPSRPEQVKILMHGKISEKCVLYKAYSEWFSTVFKQPVIMNAAELHDKNGVRTKKIVANSN